jgi:hypothetical protein
MTPANSADEWPPTVNTPSAFMSQWGSEDGFEPEDGGSELLRTYVATRLDADSLYEQYLTTGGSASEAEALLLRVAPRHRLLMDLFSILSKVIRHSR